MNKEMDGDDIRSLIEGFVKSSRNAQEAGLDGVEIHAGHPHLLGEWLTPAYNRRTDRYGGSLENRLRLVLEIVDEVRKACGHGLAVGVRINGEWRMPGGQTLEESIEVSRRLEATGQVDFINVTGWPGPLGIAPTGAPRGQLIPFAEAVKKATEGIAVFSIGRIVDPGHAERIVASGQADMVGMTRASIADPELPNKAREGRLDDIRRCIGAGQGCLGRNSLGRPITCTQNPTVGREQEWGIGTLQPAAKPKRVLVAGGGPAGMEAAIVAALRGHEVTLCEARDVLGGQVNLITKSPRRDEFAWVVEWRERQLARLGVTVQLSTLVTPDLVKSLRPDAVVVATGSTARPRGWYPSLPHLPSIPGSDQAHVFTYADALEGAIGPGNRVVLVDGLGYYQSSDAFEYLLTSGCQVTAVTATAQVTGDMYHHEREAFMRTVREYGGTILPFRVVQEIRPTAVVVEDQVSGDETTLSMVDAVVLSLGNDPNDALYRALRGEVGELYRIGDCVTPRRIEHAVFEGHRTGREL
jgi:NADPH-dependent 2,4-dienoyl-CoA reductase/sulfur reductase-like enzyme